MIEAFAGSFQNGRATRVASDTTNIQSKAEQVAWHK